MLSSIMYLYSGVLVTAFIGIPEFPMNVLSVFVSDYSKKVIMITYLCSGMFT